MENQNHKSSELDLVSSSGEEASVWFVPSGEDLLSGDLKDSFIFR